MTREAYIKWRISKQDTERMILILFDIDGTLISTDGAGIRAFRRAMQDVFGLKIETRGISPDGKTDPLILKEFLDYYQSMDLWSQRTEKKLFTRYLECLEDEMVLAQTSGSVRILPGVKKLLDVLSLESDLAVGLATGNLEAGARIKLECVGLYEYFNFGGFGSDSEDRTELIRIGIQRGERSVFPASVDDVFIVGDTPFDCIHGHAAGAGVIAVASGKYGVDELQDCNPDILLSDLTSTESILSFMRENAVKEGE